MATAEANSNSEFYGRNHTKDGRDGSRSKHDRHRKGMKATSRSSWAEPRAPATIEAPEFDGEKSSKPMRMRMMPPTIRTMLKGTPKIHRMSSRRRGRKTPRAEHRSMTGGQRAGVPLRLYLPRA